MRLALIAPLLLAGGLLFSACDSLTGGGTKKVVITENVCVGIDLLRMKLGEETEIIVDNSQHSERQDGLGLRLQEFPIIVTGELPEGASVGTNFTSLILVAPPGEERSVTARPTFTGEFKAACLISIKQGAGGSVQEREIRFQIVD